MLCYPYPKGPSLYFHKNLNFLTRKTVFWIWSDSLQIRNAVFLEETWFTKEKNQYGRFPESLSDKVIEKKKNIVEVINISTHQTASSFWYHEIFLALPKGFSNKLSWGTCNKRTKKIIFLKQLLYIVFPLKNCEFVVL